MSARGLRSWLAGAALASVLAAPTTARGDLSDDSVQREWQIREWAFETARGHIPESLRAALEDEDWIVRWSGLEALQRGVSVGGDASLLREEALVRLADDHPNVRVAAVTLARAAATAPPAGSLGPLAADRVPAVRLAAATWIAEHPSPEARAALAVLLEDGDARVAAAARVALCSGSFGGSSASDSAAERFAREADALAADLVREGTLEALSPLFFGTPSSELLEALGAACGELDDDACRAWRATLTAVRARHGRPFRTETLVDGWFANAEQLALRRQLLPWVRLDGAEGWTEPFVAGIEALEAELERPTRTRADLARLGLEPEDAQREWVAALASELGAEETLRRALDWRVSASTLRLVLEVVASRFLEWDLELGRAWASRSVSIRLFLAELWGGALMRAEDPVVADLLPDLLADPDGDVRASAFRWLCKAARPEPFGAALHRAWRAAPEETRASWLAGVPRVGLAAFREDLLELGRSSSPARPLAVEHLERYAGDAEVLEALRSWLLEEVRLFAHEVAAPGEPASAARAHEGRVVSLVRALARLDAEACVRDLEAALRVSLGASEEIGKAAAAALGRSASGRERLAAYLGEAVDLRTRIEAALQVAAGGGTDTADALAALRRDYADAGLDLRGRILEAAGRVGSREAVAWLKVLAEEGGKADPLAPPRALEALASCDPDAAVPILARIAERGEAETRRSAVAALARIGGARVTDLLVRLYRSEFAALPDASDEPALFLREALLAAFARFEPVPRGVADEVLRGPAREAAEVLERRFRSEHEPTPGFRWRGELELWSALSDEARRGVLANEPRWRGLDARLLLALADHAAGDLRRDLLRAGLIGWSGEGEGHRSGHAATRSALLEACLEAGEWGAAATIARSLRTDLERGALTPATWERELGRVQRLAGRDSLARIRSVEHQARAWAAHEAGDLDAARRWAAEARRSVGWSERARDVQARLEQRLEQP